MAGAVGGPRSGQAFGLQTALSGVSLQQQGRVLTMRGHPKCNPRGFRSLGCTESRRPRSVCLAGSWNSASDWQRFSVVCEEECDKLARVVPL